MSRIGRMPIAIPDKVKVDVKPGLVEVAGPLGKLSQTLPPGIVARVDQNQVLVEQADPNDLAKKPLHGLSRSLVFNAIEGVTKGFKKDLEIVGLGYRAQVMGDKISLQLGFAHPKEFKLPAGIKATVDAKQTAISISGVDSYLVGETAARIRLLKPPEPYKGSGIRYVGEHIIRKAGKAAAGAVGGAAGGAKK
ncbi:MAG TPA: 50S ribosomal protein L6 [Elusimicrobiota bacterium]|nr:50S ribosomal protein L6 [Elusimicrobiota bacterium]